MPTVEEILDQCIIIATKAMACKCWVCMGDGFTVDYGREGAEHKHLGDGRVQITYSTKRCDECDGDGVIVPSPTDPGIRDAAMSGAFGIIITSRALEDFDKMNRAIDWAEHFLLASIPTDGSLGDGLAELNRLVAESPLNEVPCAPPPTTASAGQLSPDELAELLGDDKKSDAPEVCEDPGASP